MSNSCDELVARLRAHGLAVDREDAMRFVRAYAWGEPLDPAIDAILKSWFDAAPERVVRASLRISRRRFH